MKKNFSRKQKIVLMIITIYCLLYFNLVIGKAFGDFAPCFTETSESNRNRHYSTDDNKLLLFIINFNDFMCLFCLDSFLNFYHSLPFSFQEELAWGILVYDEEGIQGNAEMAAKIVAKKLRGFVKANQIKFPILIDHFHIFKPLAKEGTSVFVFNQKKKSLRKFVFPLDRKQIEEIFSSLINGTN